MVGCFQCRYFKNIWSIQKTHKAILLLLVQQFTSLSCQRTPQKSQHWKFTLPMKSLDTLDEFNVFSFISFHVSFFKIVTFSFLELLSLCNIITHKYSLYICLQCENKQKKNCTKSFVETFDGLCICQFINACRTYRKFDPYTLFYKGDFS